MKDMLIKFWKDEEGATAVEYALVVGLLAGIIVAAMAVFDLTGVFTKLTAYISGKMPT